MAAQLGELDFTVPRLKQRKRPVERGKGWNRRVPQEDLLKVLVFFWNLEVFLWLKSPFKLFGKSI